MRKRENDRFRRRRRNRFGRRYRYGEGPLVLRKRKSPRQWVEDNIGIIGRIAGAAVAVILIAIILRVFIFPVPKIRLSGAKKVTLEAFDDYEDPGATARFRGKDVTDQIVVTNEVDVTHPGSYEISYQVEARGKTFSKSRTVLVRDDEAPVIELADADEELTASSVSSWEDPGYTARDNCDGDITGTVTVDIEQTDDEHFVVTYTAADQSGNEASAQRTVLIRDTVPPVVTLNGKEQISVPLGEVYEDEGAAAEDDSDGDLTDDILVSGSVNTGKIGEYTLTYTATDSSGNVGTATRTVRVKTQEDIEKEGIIYLTFDDGPSQNTEQILDILEENNVQATFFILNYSDEYIPTLQRMIDDGDTIGIHALSHDYGDCYSDDTSYLEGIHTMIEKVETDLGYTPFCIRFPGGSSNTVSREYSTGVMSRLVELVEEDGLEYYDWNADIGDANGNNIAVETLLTNFSNQVASGKENVVLCHDAATKKTTVEVLQQLIDYGNENNFIFSAIKEDSTPVHHSVNN